MIRLAHPLIPESAMEAVRTILASGKLTSGELVARFESQLAARLGGAFVVAVSSGTTAALIAFHVLRHRGIRTLLMPDFCFPSVAGSALRVGLEVRLLDLEPDRLNLAPERLAALLGKQPPACRALPCGPAKTAFLTLDQFGIPGPNGQYRQIADAAGVAWAEDAACALGSHEAGTPCGTLSDVALLSFHPRKTLTTGEGGAVVTRDPDLAEHARRLRNLGLTGEGTRRVFGEWGYNARMSELHAAVGLAQLEILDELLATRRRLGKLYLELLGRVPGVSLPAGFGLEGNNFQTLVVLLDEGVDRAAVVAGLAAAGLETTLGGFSIRQQPAFSHLAAAGPLPNSEVLHHRGLALPLHERMSEQDVMTVVRELGQVLAAGETGRRSRGIVR
jgi:dTDP-4-amino-4,6-dideoxygalactose transaminase